MKSILASLLFLTSTSHAVSPPEKILAEKFPIDSKLEGPQSRYTEKIIELIRKWPVKNPSNGVTGNPTPVKIQCIKTPEREFYIGAEQHMSIAAPLAQVAAILDDFDHYQDFFEGFKDIHVVQRDGNKTTIFWEQHIPIPFVPNIKYEMIYLVSAPTPSRRIYRYKFKGGDNIKFNDGVILLDETEDPQSKKKSTQYSEYDFWDADWGLAKTLAPGRIWKDSIEGIFVSDMTIRLKAEAPKMKNDDAIHAAKHEWDQFPVEACLKNKTEFKD